MLRRGLALTLVVLALCGAAPRPIHVVVNGKSLPADSVTLLEGKVYVGVRAIGEGLGAYVTTNAAEKSVTITTLLRQVVLHVDDTRAIVNGEEVVLPAPPRRNGAKILLPLRALGPVFGVSVVYKPATHGVVVLSQNTNVGPQPTSVASVASATYSGSVSAIDMQASPPTLRFVTASGQAVTASVPLDTPIAFRDVRGAFTGNGSLSAVRVGDTLVVTLDATGRLVSMADIFASITGTIAAVSDDSMVLTSGRVVSAAPSGQTSVTLDGKATSFGSLRAGDEVTVRADPVSGAVHDVVALTPGGYSTAATATPNPQAPAGTQTVAITRVTDNAQRPLASGGLLTVSLDGTPGGRAEFDVSDVFAHNAMRETRPGHYEGSYQASVGTNVTNAPILVRLALEGLTAQAEAPDPATIITTPPSVRETEPGSSAAINVLRPNIVVTFQTVADTGMDAQSLEIWVDGQDVSGAATRTASFISYYPDHDLRPGPVDVRIKGTDIAGNELNYEWSFAIAGG
ncbi:MAG TPA: copper amine oxidase N-terminal domain-containing protein [Candidatus Acidoferrales bacterium]|nr:copper amine oxidase N-terminal domain-containing protein [Candidatus Acidoferrales bacterium]